MRLRKTPQLLYLSPSDTSLPGRGFSYLTPSLHTSPTGGSDGFERARESVERVRQQQTQTPQQQTPPTPHITFLSPNLPMISPHTQIC